MNIIDAIRQKILQFVKLDKLDYNPNSERLTFIFDDEQIKRQQIKENKIWYIGDSNELLNYYNDEMLFGNAREPIYNRNRRQYFWAISTTEGEIKRVHSGVPNAIVTTLVNAIGTPEIKCEGKQDRVDAILKANDFHNILNQIQMPLTMVEGWGAYKVNFDTSISKYPIIQYYEAENVEFVYKSGILIGIIYKDFYKYNNQDYLLIETRRIAEGNSYIEYTLYKLGKNDEVKEVELSTIPELANLQNIVIAGYSKILGVATKFLFDPLNKEYGRSIFSGKVDLFDDLDQILSQDSQTVRVSTPVEYYPVDLLERNRNGQPAMPKVYNRQYVKKESVPNGDGVTSGDIQTTQPQLNFDQYSQNAKAKLDFILTGLLSPATMGIDIAKKDNAEAQREKEKVTIMTRNNMIDRETLIIQDLVNICLAIDEYIQTGTISIQEYEIGVNFNEFANPSFENQLQALGSAWSNGEISTKQYAKILWSGKLSDEEIAEEIEWLDNQRNQDNLELGAVEDEEAIRPNLPQEEDSDFESDQE